MKKNEVILVITATENTAIVTVTIIMMIMNAYIHSAAKALVYR